MSPTWPWPTASSIAGGTNRRSIRWRRSREEAVVDVLAAHLGEPDPLPGESLAVTVGDDGRIRCGCGWTGTTAEDADEWRVHLADAILEALGRVESTTATTSVAAWT